MSDRNFNQNHNEPKYTPVYLPIKHANGDIENFKIHRPHTKYGLIQAYQWKNTSPVACAVLVGFSLLTEITFWGFRNLTDAIKAASGQAIGNRQGQPNQNNVMDFDSKEQPPATTQEQPDAPEPTILDMDADDKALAETL